MPAARQVLDARDPLACRCPEVERYIRSVNPNKRVILLLNKMDLVPREVRAQGILAFVCMRFWGVASPMQRI